jgi:hypothetical protein
MKPLADKLPHEQILAIVRYLRTFQTAAPGEVPEAPKDDEEPAEAPGS